MPRWIIHVDMDEFFAAVEKLDNPHLRGKPILVGGDPKARGVVSTASYEARAYGCRSAMSMAKALKLCPHAVVLPVRHERYKEISEKVFEILRRFSPTVEAASIDEAFLDVTGCERLFGSPESIGLLIKKSVKEEVGLTASVGVAPNKFLAKLASDLSKPDGFLVIPPDKVLEILDPLPVDKLWGVGAATLRRFKRLGIETVGQLRRWPVEKLVEIFGKAGRDYHSLANGIDNRPVEPERKHKSLSSECTFPQDVRSCEKLRRTLLAHVEEVGRRLRSKGLVAKSVTIKLRFADFKTITRRTTLPEPTNVTEELWKAASMIFEKWASRSFRAVRLIGFCASNLTAEELSCRLLFPDPSHAKFEKLDRACDEIAERFGPEAIKRASLLSLPEEENEEE